MSNSSDPVLNIGRIVKQSKVNGPGQRFTIWVQGCSLRCKGCINKEFWPKEPNELIKVSDLYNMILDTTDIEGVTYTGGEPFEQAEGLYHLSVLLKTKGYSIMSYSGFTYKELLNSSDKFKKPLLSTLDLLVDGRYDFKKAAPLLWRGAAIKKFIFYLLFIKTSSRWLMNINSSWKSFLNLKQIKFPLMVIFHKRFLKR